MPLFLLSDLMKKALLIFLLDLSSSAHRKSLQSILSKSVLNSSYLNQNIRCCFSGSKLTLYTSPNPSTVFYIYKLPSLKYFIDLKIFTVIYKPL